MQKHRNPTCRLSTRYVDGCKKEQEPMEDRAFQNQRTVKRRLTEAQGGAEVRRLHIIYFLSRKGRKEHPHLIRIHHLSNNGVRLKDIKRWLGELRGKDLPESFAWSYKRRFKTGYVWQDLLDDDLVTPISDNEYVLKGSEISCTNHNIDFSRIPMQKEQSSLQESAKDSQKASLKESENQSHSDSHMYVSQESSSKIEESSPTFGSETSTLTDDSGKDELEWNSDRANQEANSSAFHSMALLNKEKSRTNKAEIINAKNISRTAESTDKHRFRKSHSSCIFWNLITCGTVDSMVMTNKRNRPFLNVCSSHSADWVKDSAKEKGEFKEQNAPRAAYMPLYGPKCSQCGKTFKPEKLHAHMKSCKGIKALAKGSNPAISAAENIPIT